MKATRLGMALPLDAFEVELGKEGSAKLVRQPSEIKGIYYFKQYFLDNDEFKVAVCSTDPDFSDEIKMVKL